MTPNIVATPLPPLNFHQGENICPQPAADPVNIITDGTYIASTINIVEYVEIEKIAGMNAEAKNPLAISIKRVSKPSNLPLCLNTLVAPTFPEPTFLISPCPLYLFRR